MKDKSFWIGSMVYIGAIILGLVLLIVSVASGATIREIIEQRISEEVEMNFALTAEEKEELKKQIIEEEIDRSIVRIPVITIEMIRPEVIKTIMVGLDEAETKKLTIRIYDVSYGARMLRKEVDSIAQSENFKKAMRLLPIKQSPQVEFSFLECTANSKDILWIDLSRWVNVVKLREELKESKVKVIILGVGEGAGSSMNNFDNSTEDFPMMGKEFGVFYMVCKEARPDIPIGVIAVMHPTIKKWMRSLEFEPDFWALFNINSLNANWKKIKRRFFKDKEVIAFGVNFYREPPQVKGGAEYQRCVKDLKANNYKGLVFWEGNKIK